MNPLARELAGAFGSLVESYRKHSCLSPEVARQRAAEDCAESLDRALNAPPDGVSWLDLEALAQKDAGLALERWEQVKKAARDEIRSGHRAARAVEDSEGPWARARFLAVRAELMETFHPRNAVEQQLVDQLAQWQVLLWWWQEALATWTNCASYGPRKAKKGEPYETMRLSEAEALERAMQKVERLHGLYLRTLKVLKDQRGLGAVAVWHTEHESIGPLRISMANLCLPSDFDDRSA
jgi:hypothetical protein